MKLTTSYTEKVPGDVSCSSPATRNISTQINNGPGSSEPEPSLESGGSHPPSPRLRRGRPGLELAASSLTGVFRARGANTRETPRKCSTQEHLRT